MSDRYKTTHLWHKASQQWVPVGLANHVIARLQPHQWHKVCDTDINTPLPPNTLSMRDGDALVLNSAREWALRELGYDMRGWAARIICEPYRRVADGDIIRVLRDGVPMQYPGYAVNPGATGHVVPLLVDPFGLLCQIDCAEHMMRVAWNGWGRQKLEVPKFSFPKEEP